MAEDLSMKTIARRVGLSPATVSRVFHSPHLVSPKTMEKVMNAVRESGYIYNAAAKDFSSKKSTVIGVLVPTADSLFGKTLCAIQNVTMGVGYSTIQGVTSYDLDIEQKILRQFMERRVAGIIMTGLVTGQEKLIESLANSGVPIVIVWEKLIDPRFNYVGFDNKKGGKTATEYLLSLGHHRIGMIVGPYSKVSRAKKRLDGYLEALQENNIEPDENLILERQPRFIEGAEAMGRFLSLENPPTAVFAASDVLAIGAMHAIQQAGLQVPNDISIIGFDDADFAEYLNPPLTTIRVDAHALGILAAETIVGLAKGEISDPRHYTLGTDLIVRKSCAVYPGQAR